MRYKVVYPSEKTPPDVMRVERNTEWHVRVSSESEFAHGMRWGLICFLMPPFFTILRSMKRVIQSKDIPCDEILMWYMGFWLSWFSCAMTVVSIVIGVLTQS